MTKSVGQQYTANTKRYNIIFLTDDGTLKNRHNFSVYVTEYPIYNVLGIYTTLRATSTLSFTYIIANAFLANAILSASSVFSCDYQIGTQYLATANLSAVASFSCFADSLPYSP